MIGEGILSTNQRKHTYVKDGRTVGFYTDPTLCIGCKACEVACKEWNDVPDDGFRWSGNSYDNTDMLGASTWRHVLFIEQDRHRGQQLAGPMSGDALSDLTDHEDPFRWLFLSDVCKHCEEAGCLESCPTGSIIRTETQTVLVQNDICNGCGYCVVSCPFGVIDRRPEGPSPRAAARSNAPSATTVRPAASSRLAPSPARRKASSSARWTNSGPMPPSASNSSGPPVTPTPRITTRWKPA